MIQKIISGGQDGVERAALEAAVKLEIPHGGWIPKGCRNVFPKKFTLKENASSKYSTCLEKNILSSDGTLFLFATDIKDDLTLVRHLAISGQKPFLNLDFRESSKFEIALAICKWVLEHQIRILHVTGEKAPLEDVICTDTMDVLESAIYLGHVEYDVPLGLNKAFHAPRFPKTVDEAVEALISDLPLKDRVMIANMTVKELGSLNITLGRYIRDAFGLWTDNPELLQSCREYLKSDDIAVDHASIAILRVLWEKIKPSHRLRIVK
jgi:hypothetical protein